MRLLHRKADQVARCRNKLPAVEDQVETSVEHVNKFVLGWMNMGRDEGARRERRMPRERSFGKLFRNIGLPQNIPDNTVNAGSSFGDTRCHRRYHAAPFLCIEPCQSLARNLPDSNSFANIKARPPGFKYVSPLYKALNLPFNPFETAAWAAAV